MTEDDIKSMDEYLIEQYQDEYENLSEEEKLTAIKQTYINIKNPDNRVQVTNNISNAIFYPESKAIAQLVWHKVDNLPTEEISYDELKVIPSKRGEGKLGSSNK